MKIKVTLGKDSAFNNEEHFLDCLHDMMVEWHDMEGLGCKEMAEEDAGFDSDRYAELMAFITTA